jgi:hypothetical protein
VLQARPIAMRTAVIGFFALSIVGSIGGLAPYVCCKRALLGAAVAYGAGGVAVRAINAILTQAMITSQINKDKERSGDGKDG